MKKWYPIKKQGRFCSPVSAQQPESLLFGTVPSLIKTVMSRFWRKRGNPADWLAPEQLPFRSQELRITWIGHATFLIQVAGKNILTDPVFGNVTPFFPRSLEPGIQLALLPSIDYVLISHNHWDHMDAASLTTLRARNPGITVLVPEGDKKWFVKRRFAQVEEYSWWNSHTADLITFSFVPSVHWSARGLFDKNRSLWGSWMISVKDHHVYFAGDTAYGDHFKQIASEFPSIDAALLPIGPCEPFNWMKHSHTSGQLAIKAFHDLNARYFIPMHWGTFPFGTDNFDEPINRLQHAWNMDKKKTPEKKLRILKAGSSSIISL